MSRCLSFVSNCQKLCARVISLQSVSEVDNLLLYEGETEKVNKSHTHNLPTLHLESEKQTHGVNNLCRKTQQPDTISSVSSSYTCTHSHTHSLAPLSTHIPPANNLAVYLRICPTPSCSSACQRRKQQPSRQRLCGRKKSANELRQVAARREGR